MRIESIAVDTGPIGARRTRTPLLWDRRAGTAFRAGVHALGDVEVVALLTEAGSGVRVDLSVRRPARPGARPVALERVRLLLDAHPRLVLESGWQSWSPVARRLVTDVSPLRRLAPAWVRGTYHAAPELAGRAVCGDHFLLMATGCGGRAAAGSLSVEAPGNTRPGGVAGFLDARRHLSTMVPTADGVVVHALLDGVTLAPGDERQLDPLWLAAGDPGTLYSEYVERWSRCAGARAAGPSPIGWGSWYQFFWKVNPTACRRNLKLAAAHGLELFQLDDGYQRAVGDWLEPNDRFAPAEVPALAAEIEAAGMQPGIWTAPFLAAPSSRVAREHPEWLVQRHDAAPGGRTPLRAMWNPLAWGGWALALDTTHPGVLEHLRETFGSLRAQGWRFHKIDFCYAAAMPGRRYRDGTWTRAEALRAGLEAVREGIGDDATLLGCGIPLAPSVGLVDAMRVSPDTGPTWGPGALRLPGYPDLSPAAVSALQVSVLRAPMHRRLWVNDPDCLLLRPTRTRLGADERAVLAAAVGGTGGWTLLSDDLITYGPEQWATLDTLRALHERADRPLDLVDPFAPAPEVRGRGEGGLALSVQWAPAPAGVSAAARHAPVRAESSDVLLAGGRPPRVPWAVLRSG